jgi:hypothetical protein
MLSAVEPIPAMQRIRCGRGAGTFRAHVSTLLFTTGATMAKKRRRKYGKKAQSKVARAMRERKRGKLKSGRSGKTVKSRKQAIAIGLSEARRSGAKVPAKRRRRKKGRRKRAA